MTSNSDLSLPVGTLLQGKNYRYRIIKRLGQGSFGITYLAELIEEGNNSTMFVALKEFFMSDINGRSDCSVTNSSSSGLFFNYRKKFIREAENLQRISHDNVVKVVELFEANNTVYYAMSYISGTSLDDLIRNSGALPEKEALRITSKIAEALRELHSHGMVHLDLKPGNVMMLGNSIPILIDFGLSKTFNENGEAESSTTIGSGTPGYAPLEQSSHQDSDGLPVTMDIYALGGTLFKMLTGERPPYAFDILNIGFPADMLRSRGISEATIALIARCMAPIKGQRFQTADAVIAAISNNNSVSAPENTAYTPSQSNQMPPVTPPPGYVASNYTSNPGANNPNSNHSNNGIWKWIAIGAGILIAIVIIIGALSGSETTADVEDEDSTEIVADTAVAVEVESASNENTADSAEVVTETKETEKQTVENSKLVLSGDMEGFPIRIELNTSNPGNITGKYYNIKYKATYSVTGYYGEGTLFLSMKNGNSVWDMTLDDTGSGFRGYATNENGGRDLSVNLSY